jgi:predicted phage terminase large subunit-like protein
MWLPTLEEFFVAHGHATQSPRTVRQFHRDIFAATTMWVAGTLPGGARNLAINLPPRHGKTFIARDLVSWGLGCFPDSEWIYTSCSATLAVTQTMAIKNAVSSDWYRKVFPFVGVFHGSGRQEYFTTPAGGSVYGVGMGGTLTGFGAGKKRQEFGGGIVVDDPMQAKDAFSLAIRERCNQWYSQVLYSRRTAAHTPVLIIMQRLHESDLVGYVRDNEPDLWHVLEIPVMDEGGELLWPETFDADSARRMESLDPFTYNAQYMQSPTPQGGAMIKTDWIQRPEHIPTGITALVIAMDTAQKTAERNDFSALGLWGLAGRNVVTLDIERGKWTAPDLLEKAEDFIKRHRPPVGSPVKLRGVLIEDKASGTGLIQSLQRKDELRDMPIIAVQRSRDKVSRVNDVLPWVKAGQLWVPLSAPWAKAYIGELASFSPAMTHKNDDQVDITVDAMNELLSLGGGLVPDADWS